MKKRIVWLYDYNMKSSQILIATFQVIYVHYVLYVLCVHYFIFMCFYKIIIITVQAESI